MRCVSPRRPCSPRATTARRARFDVGDAWTYSCQVQTKAGQTEVVNTATVKGTDENDRTATDEDTFTTTLAQPPVPPVEPPAEPRAAEPVAAPQPQPQIVVAPAAVVSGTAKLRGLNGCPTRTVTASVTGRRIVRVTWYLDGKRIAVSTKADAMGRWTVPVRPKLRYGAAPPGGQGQLRRVVEDCGQDPAPGLRSVAAPRSSADVHGLTHQPRRHTPCPRTAGTAGGGCAAFRRQEDRGGRYPAASAGGGRRP